MEESGAVMDLYAYARKEYTPMDPAIKERWLEALRSGEYEQGFGRLRRTNSVDGKDSFCCLGVLCDIVLPEGWEEVEVSPGSVHADGFWHHDGYSGTYSPDVAVKAGLKEDPHTYKASIARALFWMNDREGKSFGEIADWIEEHL